MKNLWKIVVMTIAVGVLCTPVWSATQPDFARSASNSFQAQVAFEHQIMNFNHKPFSLPETATVDSPHLVLAHGGGGGGGAGAGAGGGDGAGAAGSDCGSDSGAGTGGASCGSEGSGGSGASGNGNGGNAAGMPGMSGMHGGPSEGPSTAESM